MEHKWVYPVCSQCTSLLAIKVAKNVSLFSLEVEDIALPEDVKKVMFMIQLLGSMKILVT